MKTITLVAIFVVFLGSTAAFADPITLVNGGGSVTLSYQTSFSGSNGTATFSLSGSILTVTLTNTSTDLNTRLSGIGFDTTPNTDAVSVNGVLANTLDWELDGAGVGGFEVSAGNPGTCSTGGAGALCVDAGEVASSTIQITLQTCTGKGKNQVCNPLAGNLTIDNSVLHFQSLPNGDSEKPEGEIPNTPIPEPASMILLGSGMAGVASLIRRRTAAGKKL